MTDPIKPPRRRVLTQLLGFAGLGILPDTAKAAVPTPQQTEGPFYPTPSMRHADIDNDLVKISGAVRQAGGQIVRLEGRVLDRNGNPVAGARVEIWQCDAKGRYLHTGDRDRGPNDQAFQGFGHDITDDQGQYIFRTIKPVAYPGRAPHIHVKVFAQGRDVTTQFYTEDEAANERDVLFRRLSPSEQQALLMRFETRSDEPRAWVDIVI